MDDMFDEFDEDALMAQMAAMDMGSYKVQASN